MIASPSTLAMSPGLDEVMLPLWGHAPCGAEVCRETLLAWPRVQAGYELAAPPNPGKGPLLSPSRVRVTRSKQKLPPTGRVNRSGLTPRGRSVAAASPAGVRRKPERPD